MCYHLLIQNVLAKLNQKKEVRLLTMTGSLKMKIGSFLILMRQKEK